MTYSCKCECLLNLYWTGCFDGAFWFISGVFGGDGSGDFSLSYHEAFIFHVIYLLCTFECLIFLYWTGCFE